MKWHVELDPFSYMEDIIVLMCGDKFMLIGDSGDLAYMRSLCDVLNEMEQYAYSGS